ncbi:hypothetical protein ACQJBY_042359 [Aegilops geniculata]
MDSYEYSELERALGDKSMGPIVIPYSVLKTITNNFSDDQLIGGGGFGAVYKGTLRNGMVAVKKLYKEKFEVLSQNFDSEVNYLKKVKHKNIVRFLGHCSNTQMVPMLYEGKEVLAEDREKLLCFEYLSKGSLANYLTGDIWPRNF